MTMTMQVLDAGQQILAAVPDPSKGGGNPPGWNKLLMVLHWVFLGVTIMAVAGFLIVGGRMALAWRRGEGAEHASGLGVACIACIIIGSASGLVSTLTA
ncbi:hypothetical protein ACFY72_35005 [Streptomyces globisporus]|uniref:hypothetical protein n=1 Tax=Streptomyces globisporus TaxID=1908 RepID=UPI00369F4CD7